MVNTPQEKALLILDLDECLIHGSETELHRVADFRIGPFHIYCRPGLREFLTGASQLFDLAVWSSATSDYVEHIASNICPDKIEWRFVWARERCTSRRDWETQEMIYIKDLKKVKRLGYSLDRILFVDDTAAKLARNFGNAIYIAPFEGASDDCELRKLLTYLTSIQDETNFRTIEKRGWRTQLHSK